MELVFLFSDFLLRHHRPWNLLKMFEKEKVHHPIDRQPSFNLNSWMALGVPGLDFSLRYMVVGKKHDVLPPVLVVIY